jgi:hypothetical protein
MRGNYAFQQLAWYKATHYPENLVEAKDESNQSLQASIQNIHNI